MGTDGHRGTEVGGAVSGGSFNIVLILCIQYNVHLVYLKDSTQCISCLFCCNN